MSALLLATVIVIFVLICAAVIMNTSQPTNTIQSQDFRTVVSTDVKPANQNLEHPLIMFNLSVMRNDMGYHGVVRGTTHNTSPQGSYPYSIILDTTADHITGLELIDLDYDLWKDCAHKGHRHPYGIEDPRIFTYADELWVIANSLGYKHQTHPCVNTMCLFKLAEPRTTFRILTPPSDVSKDQVQKNWVPFEYQGKLLCEYSLKPHKILEINLETGTTDYAYVSEESEYDVRLSSALRGGAPPIRIDDYFLGIGHTRFGYGSYLHFFYTFQAVAPFNITWVSKPFKIDGNERIQFVAGMSYYDNVVHISYGVSDTANRVSRFKLEYIQKLMHDDLVTDAHEI